MKKLIYLFLFTLLFSATASFGQTSTTAQPIFKYLGRLAQDPAKCSVTTPTQYFNTVTKRFKFCSDTDTFSEFDEKVSTAVNLSKFGGTLASAIATIGANKTILNISQNTTVSAALIIPANIVLKQENGAKIVKAGSATINCQGNCLADPMSDTPFFSNFAVGNVTFSGINYPTRLSTAIFDNQNASTRINLADRALLGKPAEIHATPGHIGERVIITEYHFLRLGIGVFTNDVGVAYYATFQLHSNTRVQGAGLGLTIVRESSSQIFGANGLFYAESVQITGANGTNQNITISDLTILGADNEKPTDQQNSAISLGNVENGLIERVHIKATHGFGAYVGGNGSLGNYSKNSKIINNIFERIGTQNTGSTNSDGLTISGNQFIGGNTVASNYSYYIDCETNGQGRMQNITISDNLMEGFGPYNPLRELYGIAVNAAGIRSAHSIIITGNILKGYDVGSNPDDGDGFTVGITLNGVEDVTLSNNKIGGMKNVGISVFDGSAIYANNNTLNAVGSFNGIPAVVLRGVTNSIFRNNDFPIIRTHEGSQTSPTSNSNFGFSKLIEERGMEMTANVAITGGVSTVTVTQGDRNVYEWWKGKTVYLAPAAGITAGNYTVATVDYGARKFTLTTAAGSGSTTVTTRLGGNKYINNSDAQYSLQANTISTIVEASSSGFTRSVGLDGIPASGVGVEMFYNPDNANGYIQTYNRSTPGYGPLNLDASTLLLNPNSGGNVLLGTGTNSGAKLQIGSGDIHLKTAGTALILTSLDGSTCARVTIANGTGAIVSTVIPCP